MSLIVAVFMHQFLSNRSIYSQNEFLVDWNGKHSGQKQAYSDDHKYTHNLIVLAAFSICVRW